MIGNLELIIPIVSKILIIVSCIAIFIRTKKVYSLTYHKGIKIFRQSFLFFSISFFLLSLIHVTQLIQNQILLSIGSIIVFTIFNYAISVASFYFTYSLVWKEFEKKRTIFIHIIAIIIAITATIYNPLIIFITQMLSIGYAITISYSNYKTTKNNNKYKFKQFHFIALVLGLFVYFTNFLSCFFNSLPIFFKISSQVLASIIFIIFLKGVYSITEWPKKGKD